VGSTHGPPVSAASAASSCYGKEELTESYQPDVAEYYGCVSMRTEKEHSLARDLQLT
jgi:hypothetical protein